MRLTFSVHGLSGPYQNDVDFANLCRKFSALAFVPEEKVEEYFKLLLNSQDFANYKDQLADFVDYFEVQK